MAILTGFEVHSADRSDQGLFLSANYSGDSCPPKTTRSIRYTTLCTGTYNVIIDVALPIQTGIVPVRPALARLLDINNANEILKITCRKYDEPKVGVCTLTVVLH
jgi:hypothetical protein